MKRERKRGWKTAIERYRGYELGNDIVRKQNEQGWGAKVIDQLSADLQKRYGGDSGYSA